MQNYPIETLTSPEDFRAIERREWEAEEFMENLHIFYTYKEDGMWWTHYIESKNDESYFNRFPRTSCMTIGDVAGLMETGVIAREGDELIFIGTDTDLDEWVDAQEDAEVALGD